MSISFPICMIRTCGEGRRMRPLTDYFQKCILPVRGKPLLAHWLDAFNAQGVSLPLYVVYRHRWIQVLDVIREWRAQQEKCHPILDTIYESQYPDRIWEDIQGFWQQSSGERTGLKGRRRNPLAPLLLCNGDNWSPELATVIRDMLALQSWLSEDILGIMGIIISQDCSSGTEEAIIGEKKFAESLWPVKNYRWGLPEGNGRQYLSSAGIGLFSPQAMEVTMSCVDPREAIAQLAQMGKLAGWRIWQEFMDVGTPEAYRRVGAI